MTNTSHTAYFGDASYTFNLPNELVAQLERKSGAGIGAIYQRVISSQFYAIDILEIIRLGLIGGGTAPIVAEQLIDAYARPRPIVESYLLAFDILDARWNGKPDAAADEPVAAATGDMSAAINETMEATGL